MLSLFPMSRGSTEDFDAAAAAATAAATVAATAAATAVASAALFGYRRGRLSCERRSTVTTRLFRSSDWWLYNESAADQQRIANRSVQIDGRMESQRIYPNINDNKNISKDVYIGDETTVFSKAYLCPIRP